MIVTIDWMKDYGNNPRIEVRGIELPPHVAETDPVWERRGNLHRCDQGDFVRYFHSTGQPTDGYGGARFAGTFRDGTKFEYKGAWSSRAGCINREWPESSVVDVSFRDLYLAGHMKAEAIIKWRRENDAAFGLAWLTEENGEKYLMPTLMGALKNKPYKNSVVQHLEF